MICMRLKTSFSLFTFLIVSCARPLPEQINQCMVKTQAAIRNDFKNNNQKEISAMIRHYRDIEERRKRIKCCAIEPVRYDHVAAKFVAPLHLHTLVRVDYLESQLEIKSRNDSNCYGLLNDIYHLLNRRRRKDVPAQASVKAKLEEFKENQLEIDLAEDGSVVIYTSAILKGRKCFDSAQPYYLNLELERKGNTAHVSFAKAEQFSFECEVELFGRKTITLKAGTYQFLAPGPLRVEKL